MSEQRKRGRPVSKQSIVMRTVRFDKDLDKYIQSVADYTGIPYGRMVNAICRAYANEHPETSLRPILKAIQEGMR